MKITESIQTTTAKTTSRALTEKDLPILVKIPASKEAPYRLITSGSGLDREFRFNVIDLHTGQGTNRANSAIINGLKINFGGITYEIITSPIQIKTIRYENTNK